MNKADVFEVVARTCGLLACIKGTEKSAGAVLSGLGAFKPPAGTSPKDYVIGSIPAFTVGVALLIWAPSIAGIFYR